eukprot:EG_transcript_42567
MGPLAGPPPVPAGSVTQAMLWHLECPICFELMRDAVVTSCGHSFCHACATHNCPRGAPCPSCRTAVAAVIPNYFIRELIADVSDVVAHAPPPPAEDQPVSGLQWLDGLGFPPDIAVLAYRQANYNAERALELAIHLTDR